MYHLSGVTDDSTDAKPSLSPASTNLSMAGLSSSVRVRRMLSTVALGAATECLPCAKPGDAASMAGGPWACGPVGSSARFSAARLRGTFTSVHCASAPTASCSTLRKASEMAVQAEAKSPPCSAALCRSIACSVVSTPPIGSLLAGSGLRRTSTSAVSVRTLSCAAASCRVSSATRLPSRHRAFFCRHLLLQNFACAFWASYCFPHASQALG